jgi:hypothetical protein
MTDDLSRLFLDLAAARVEVAPHPERAGVVRHRPADLPPDLRERLRANREAVARLLAEGYAPDDPEARHRFLERLGIGDDLGMPTHPGSVAWLVAVGESLAIVALESTSRVQ